MLFIFRLITMSTLKIFTHDIWWHQCWLLSSCRYKKRFQIENATTSLLLEFLQVLVVPSIPSQLGHVNVNVNGSTYARKRPVSSLGASRASFEITLPGCSGLSRWPPSWAPVNLECISASKVVPRISRRSRCISVSTIPGWTATETRSGSSHPMVWARLFNAALDAA